MKELKSRQDAEAQLLALVPSGQPTKPSVRARSRFNGVKVFSATKVYDRQLLGEAVTAWLAARSNVVIADMVVTHSSDAQFHCLSITVFFDELASGSGEIPISG